MVAGGEMLAAGLAHADIEILDDIGHEPFIEEPEKTFGDATALPRT